MNDERSWKFSLYQEDNLKLSENELSFFLQSQGICKLVPNEDALVSEGRLTVEECLKSLNFFQNNKSPGMGSVFFKYIYLFIFEY